MRHYLESIVETAIMLALDVVSLAVTYCHNLICTVTILTRTIDFKFNAEVSCAIAVENGLGLVVVIFYSTTSAVMAITRATIRLIAVIVFVISVIPMN